MESELDYYAIFDLQRGATDEQIKQAYRKLSLQHHPLRHPNDAAARKQFQQIAEAYDVLTNPSTRALFDQYGERGLKEGASNGRGGSTAPYVFTLDPEQLFQQQFGAASPFLEFFSQPHNQYMNFKNAQTKVLKKTAAQELPLYVSLEELYKGCLKSQKVSVRKLDSGDKGYKIVEKVIRVELLPGWKENTLLTFEKEGDEYDGEEVGDIVFRVLIKPHPRFVRRGNDLVYKQSLSLKQALIGTNIEIDMLDGRALPVTISDVASPSSPLVIPGEGMPHPKKAGVKGNLVIEFDVTYPASLTLAQKKALEDILPSK